MAKNDDCLVMDGVIEECLPNTNFRVKLENGAVVLGHLSGKMKMNSIRVLLGDKVKVSISTYDLTKCRIEFRSK